MFLTSEAGNFLIIAIIAVFIIAFALIIYLLITSKKNGNKEIADENTSKNNEESFSNEITNVKNEEAIVNNFNVIEEAEKRISENENQVEELQLDNEVLEKKEESSAITNIASVLSEMQKDLDASKKNEEEIARYEDEEEKNAIISYKELMKYKDIQDKDIVLEEKTKEEIKDVIENNPETVKKFKRSEFISPIFGYNDDSNVTYREIKRPPRKEKVKNTEFEWESDRILKDLEDSNTEIMEFEEKEDNVSDNTTRFLDELVDFRKKLD